MIESLSSAAAREAAAGNAALSPLPGSPHPCRGKRKPLAALELKVIADVGLVGYPNAGKSTIAFRHLRGSPKSRYPYYLVAQSGSEVWRRRAS